MFSDHDDDGGNSDGVEGQCSREMAKILDGAGGETAMISDHEDDDGNSNGGEGRCSREMAKILDGAGGENGDDLEGWR